MKSEHLIIPGMDPNMRQDTAEYLKSRKKRTTQTLQINDANKMTLKPGTASGVILRIFCYRHHVQQSVKLDVPKESSFPIPHKLTDVVRRTKMTLDVL